MSAWQPVNTYIAPFQLAIGANVTGTATYRIEYTYAPASQATATDVFTLLADQSAPAEAVLAHPVAAVRLNVTAGTGTVSAYLVQAG